MRVSAHAGACRPVSEPSKPWLMKGTMFFRGPAGKCNVNSRSHAHRSHGRDETFTRSHKRYKRLIAILTPPQPVARGDVVAQQAEVTERVIHEVLYHSPRGAIEASRGPSLRTFVMGSSVTSVVNGHSSLISVVNQGASGDRDLSLSQFQKLGPGYEAISPTSHVESLYI